MEKIKIEIRGLVIRGNGFVIVTGNRAPGRGEDTRSHSATINGCASDFNFLFLIKLIDTYIVMNVNLTFRFLQS